MENDNSVETRESGVSKSRRGCRSDGMLSQAKTGVANANSRPADIARDYWVTGIKIDGTPKTGSERHTRRCNGARMGTGMGAWADAGGRLPELWSRRSTAFGRVLKCVISDRDLSPCPDYATSSALCPRRYALRAESRRSPRRKQGDLSISDRTP